MNEITITHEITEHISTLSVSKSGWSKELNMVSWSGRNPVFDIRTWSPDHKRSGKGITLTEEETAILADVLSGIYSNQEEKKSKGEVPNG